MALLILCNFVMKTKVQKRKHSKGFMKILTVVLLSFEKPQNFKRYVTMTKLMN